MLKLHGMSRSNYYSLIKAALLEKAVIFEEVASPPSQDSDYLGKSPMGKVPCLETDLGFISESYAILDYLEILQPEPALFPADPFARAKIIELIRHLELDVELVARRALPAAFFGAQISEELKDATQTDLARGMAAVARLIKCDPFIGGAEFTAADLYAFYTFGLARAIVAKVFDADLLEGHGELGELLDRLSERPCIHKVEAAKAA